MILLNPYGVDMGTSGLIIQAQSQEEIYTDKLLAKDTLITAHPKSGLE